MTKLKEKRVAEILAEIKARVEGMERDCPEFCRRANDDMDSGISGVSYAGGGSRRSGPADPVGERAGRFDRPGTQAQDFHKALLAAYSAVKWLDAKAWALMPMPEDLAKAMTKAEAGSELTGAVDLSEQTRSATCANLACKALVSRSKNDRLREGRCQACYAYRRRTGMERPRHLCANTEDVVSTDALGLDMDRLLEEPA